MSWTSRNSWRYFGAVRQEKCFISSSDRASYGRMSLIIDESVAMPRTIIIFRDDCAAAIISSSFEKTIGLNASESSRIITIGGAVSASSGIVLDPINFSMFQIVTSELPFIPSCSAIDENAFLTEFEFKAESRTTFFEISATIFDVSSVNVVSWSGKLIPIKRDYPALGRSAYETCIKTSNRKKLNSIFAINFQIPLDIEHFIRFDQIFHNVRKYNSAHFFMNFGQISS